MGLSRIGSEEVAVLAELEGLCMFRDVKERVEFRLAVCRKSKCNMYEQIYEDDFEVALLTARSLLQERGRDVFRKRSA